MEILHTLPWIVQIDFDLTKAINIQTGLELKKEADNNYYDKDK